MYFTGVFGGLDAHGSPIWPPWVRLTKTANVNDMELHLDTAVVGWKANQEILITATGYDPEHNEVHTIASISGKVLHLNKKLNYRHICKYASTHTGIQLLYFHEFKLFR